MEDELNIRGRLIELLSEASEKDASSISDETSLIEDLELDSLRIMILIGDIEDEFGVKMQGSRLKTILHVGELAAYLTELSEG